MRNYIQHSLIGVYILGSMIVGGYTGYVNSDRVPSGLQRIILFEESKDAAKHIGATGGALGGILGGVVIYIIGSNVSERFRRN